MVCGTSIYLLEKHFKNATQMFVITDSSTKDSKFLNYGVLSLYSKKPNLTCMSLHWLLYNGKIGYMTVTLALTWR